MDLKQLTENILSDLTSNVDLTSILLKVKLYAGICHDDSLLSWVTEELEGYKSIESLPDYRKVSSNIRVDGALPYTRVNGYELPLDLISDEQVIKYLSVISIANPISQVEDFLQKKDMLSVNIPAHFWRCLEKNLKISIDRAYQYTNSSSLNKIISNIKSLLIDYFINNIDNNSLSFENILYQKQQVIMNNTINAGIYNAGAGSVSASNSIIGDNNSVNVNSHCDNLKSIIDEIDYLMPETGDDYQECSSLIKSELDKQNPDNRILKMAFKAIKDIAFSVATQPIVNKITDLISKAISLL